MDWNENSALQWDWENHGLFCGAKNAGISGFGDGGSSSKNSTSASADSSSKEGWKISGFSFEAVEGFPRRRSGPNKNEELARVEPLIGLKLGKRTYFENVSNGNNSASSNSPCPSTALVKKARVSHQSVLYSRCQVEGCGIDLSGAKDYHRKHRVCEGHSKCPKVIVAGQERRFCQQCSRFHDLREFDQKKRSCRRRLSDHNARRRKPQPDLSFNSSGFSASFYDDKHQPNFLINRAPFALMRPTASSTWETSCGFSITHSTKTTKAGGMDGQLQFSNSELPNAAPAVPQDLDKLLPFNGTTAEVFTLGVEASAVPASDSDVGGPDLRRALSLLSTDFWVHPDSLVQSNLSQQVNATSYDNSAMQVSNTTPMGHWQEEPSPPPHQAQLCPFELHNNNGGRYLEFPLSKFPHETSFFDSGQILSKSDGHFLEFKT